MTTKIGINLHRDLERLISHDLETRHGKLSRQAAEVILEYNLLSQPAFSFCTVPVDQVSQGIVVAQGKRIYAPRVIPESGELTSIGCSVCTLGQRISDQITTLFKEKKASLALALDELANRLLFELIRRMLDRMMGQCLREGLDMGVELHPGEPGLTIEALSVVCDIAGAENIGVSVHDGTVMTPIKSRAILVGIGKSFPATLWSRCTECPTRNKCPRGQRKEAMSA